ncbi:uncharacterized protein LOC123506026 [Portunus trituberculatus]|uniref:uncharacterized protein LOC123506026 n=1 Tax=Portunus trituberculatus TaxID=210409 RepID=UPI001E1CBCAD|nr:uncharacterized protein LOC123506026 [Portunus trituberculatus]
MALGSLSYWLMVMCVAFPLATCDASNIERLGTHPYYRQSSWPRPYKLPGHLYSRLPQPILDLQNNVWGRSSRPATLPISPRLENTNADLTDATSQRHGISRRPQASNHRHGSRRGSLATANSESGSLSSSVFLSEPRNRWTVADKQWKWPRRFFTSSSTLGGRSHSGGRQACENGKVWRRGQCRCPYLSRWDTETNKCECIYGTYRHASGNCYNY